MSKKRPLSNIFDEDVIVVLISGTDDAAKALRCEHNQPYLYDERPVFSSTSRRRTAWGETPQSDVVPMVKLMIKFSHSPNSLEGLSAGSDPGCNIMFENGQKKNMSRFQYCFTFDEETKALLLSNTSSHGTELTTKTFPQDNEGSRLTRSGTYDLFKQPMVLSEGDEIRAGIMVLKVESIRRPEQLTAGWNQYCDNVNNFLRQSKTKLSIARREDTGIPTVVNPSILGLLSLAGRGSHAQVYKMIDTQGRLYGVKVPQHQGLNDIIQRELECLRKLSHKNIVSLVNDRRPSFPGPAIVMDYFPTSLREFSPPAPSIIRPLGAQLFDALQYLHSLLVVHCDVKPGNVLISSVEPFQIKLADFSISSIDKARLETMHGTLRYMAPEVRLGKSCDAKADVWAAGVVVAEYCLPEGYFRDLEDRKLASTPVDVIDALLHVPVDEDILENVVKPVLVEDPQDRKSAREVWDAILSLPNSEDNKFVDEQMHPRAITDDDVTTRLSTSGDKTSEE